MYAIIFIVVAVSLYLTYKYYRNKRRFNIDREPATVVLHDGTELHVTHLYDIDPTGDTVVVPVYEDTDKGFIAGYSEAYKDLHIPAGVILPITVTPYKYLAKDKNTGLVYLFDDKKVLPFEPIAVVDVDEQAVIGA